MAGGNVTVDQSISRGILARGDAALDQSGVGLLVAREATVNNSAIGFLVAWRVNGDAKPMFGAVEAAVFGVLFGVGVGLVNWLRTRFGRRS
jgi:hypothetical protein